MCITDGIPVPVVICDPANKLHTFIEVAGENLLWQGGKLHAYVHVNIIKHAQVDIFLKTALVQKYKVTVNLKLSLQLLLPHLGSYQQLSSSYSTFITETTCKLISLRYS